MIQKAVAQFAAEPDCESIHLPFYFTPDFRDARQAGAGKLRELARVIARLFRIRARGPIDLLLYPVGGPQTVPLIRDLLLLPWMLLCARKVVLHFHAAGIADRCESRRGDLLSRVLPAIYGKAAAAVVMTNFNRRDPEFCGIKEILVRPHKIPDEIDAALVVRDSAGARKHLLYVGHLHPDKGTEALLHAFAAVRKEHRGATLELVGECLPPWNRKVVESLIERLDLGSAVTLRGVLTGREKWAAFGRADLFVFPTVAPYESFGLVLVEAMMWRLPIIASEWRGNQDVLTPKAGGISFPPEPLERELTNALRIAFERANEWQEWGQTNRALYEVRYREQVGDLWLAEALFAAIPLK